MKTSPCLNLAPRRTAAGQAGVEYALLLALVGLVVLVVLLLLGPQVSGMYATVATSLPAAEGEGSSIVGIMQDFRTRIEDFRARTGRWPRSWGDYRFTDLGMDPAEWASPVEGIQWNPNGNKVGLANVPGDNRQVYVNTPGGDTLKLYDGWSVWCEAGSTACYYHTVAPGNEVDISTLVVVEE